MEQTAIRRAWERFLTNGDTLPGLSPSLAASWERSRASGIGSSLTEAPLFDEPEVFRRRSQTLGLLNAARPALARAGIFLAESSSMLILTDPGGVIVETAGDPRVVDKGRRNHLETGGRWDEGAIGTNAIGTALVEGRPIQIRGAEHFCEDVQRWTCAATPVRHPLDREILGVVDISGPMTSFNTQSLALAVTIGQEIEASLGKAVKAEHEVLLQHFLSKRSIWLSEEVLVVDRRGILVHEAQHARQKLDAQSNRDLARQVKESIGFASLETWERNCRQIFPNASLELVHHDNDVVGCLIVLHKVRASKKTVSIPSKQPGESHFGFDQIIGQSTAIEAARQKAIRLASGGLPVLIEGETGVGKELFARAIKSTSPRAGGPFVPVNCGGMPHALIASELFGYAKGAFTGADERGHAGKIESADGGVLCLDEIGEMPLDLQSYLLRVLEDNIVYRVGDHEPRQADIRIISMTNRDLGAEIEAGRFRRDLYYRIAAVRLIIPPLRHRGDDVVILARKFAAAAAAKLGRVPPTFSPALLDAFCAYHWPGNVRQLRNVIDAMVSLSDAEQLDTGDMPEEIWPGCDARSAGIGIEQGSASSQSGIFLTSKKKDRDVERAAILSQIEAVDGNLTEAARRLGIARSTLYQKLAKYRAGEPE